MTFTDKHIVETYSNLFEGLSSHSKLELIESLSKSLKVEKKSKENTFYKSFGAFASTKAAEVIIKDIKSSRKFKKKEMAFTLTSSKQHTQKAANLTACPMI